MVSFPTCNGVTCQGGISLQTRSMSFADTAPGQCIVSSSPENTLVMSEYITCYPQQLAARCGSGCSGMGACGNLARLLACCMAPQAIITWQEVGVAGMHAAVLRGPLACMLASLGRLWDARRYISEDFGGVALHPIDVLDASTGRLLSQLVDANLSTICPVNKPHPRVNVIVSGSSRSLYAWRPVSGGNRG